MQIIAFAGKNLHSLCNVFQNLRNCMCLFVYAHTSLSMFMSFLVRLQLLLIWNQKETNENSHRNRN